jgi:hypothetical protein
MKQFQPNAGAYKKIDVFINPINGCPVYMHSTNAYNTLHTASIGAALSLEKMGNKYYCTIRDGMGFAKIQVNPYTIRAFFAEKA